MSDWHQTSLRKLVLLQYNPVKSFWSGFEWAESAVIFWKQASSDPPSPPTLCLGIYKCIPLGVSHFTCTQLHCHDGSHVPQLQDVHLSRLCVLQIDRTTNFLYKRNSITMGLFSMPQPNKTKLPLQVLAVIEGNSEKIRSRFKHMIGYQIIL